MFFFSLSFNFALNALFYTDDQLSSRYEKGELSFFEDLLRSLPSTVIETIIISMFKSFISYPPIFEMLIKEVKTKKLIVFIQKYFTKVKIKLMLFFLLQMIIDGFIIYYLTLFSIIYKSSQVSWFTGCLYSFFLSILTSCGICIGLTILRVFALKYQYKWIYNIQLYANNIL